MCDDFQFRFENYSLVVKILNPLTLNFVLYYRKKTKFKFANVSSPKCNVYTVSHPCKMNINTRSIRV